MGQIGAPVVQLSIAHHLAFLVLTAFLNFAYRV